MTDASPLWPSVTVQKCNECGRDLPLTDEHFYRRGDDHARFHKRCKECYRRYCRNHWVEKGATKKEERRVYLQTERNPDTGTMFCTRCRRQLPVSEFYQDKRYSGGYAAWCKACYAEYGATWRESRKEALALNSKQRRFGCRLNALIHYGGNPPTCACCGESRFEFLALDHMGGGGRQERLRVGSGERFFRYLQKAGYPAGYRVLCHNCNQAIGVYGYCPHQTGPKEVQVCGNQ